MEHGHTLGDRPTVARAAIQTQASMKPQFRSKFPIAATCSAMVAAAPMASAETLGFSGSGTVRMLATNWAAHIGGSTRFDAGTNDWGRLYWRGTGGDGQYLHFDLGRLAGLTILSDAAVTLRNANDTWGGSVANSFIGSANAPWVAAGNSWVPGATLIADATHATGNHPSGASVTWSVGATTFQGYVDNAPSFHGLAIIGGPGSTLHFSGPADPYLEVATNSAMANVVTVAGGAAWNASNHSFIHGVLTIGGVLAGGASGAGAVTVNRLGTVFVNGSGGDNHYWDIDSSIIHQGGVVVIQGHSHIHHVTLAGGELGGIRPNGTYGSWSFDDPTTVTGGLTSILSAEQMNSDNGNFNVDAGSTLEVTGSFRSGSIIKGGGGTMILGGGNQSSGGITVNGGTLVASKSAQDDGIHTLGYGPLVVNNGGTFRSTRNWTTSSEWNATSVGSITINQGGTWSIEGVGQTIQHGLQLNGGTITATVSHGDWGALHLKSEITAGGNAVSSIDADTALNWGRIITVDEGSRLNHTGVIHNQIGTNGSITKAGAGTLSLSGNSVYTGVTTLAGGVLDAASFADNGVASSLGVGTGDTQGEAIGIVFRGGTLQYTGSTAQSTNRHIRLSTTGGGGTIDASGSTPSATLRFTAPSPVNFFENPGNRTLTLTGTNPGDNSFATAIGEAGGTTSLLKRGPGKWIVSGSNSYTGPTSVDGGTLSLGNGVSNTNLADVSNVFLASNAVLDLNFNGSDEIGAFVVDGVDQGSGTFDASTHPGSITGTGSLTVLANDGVWTSTTDGNWGTQANWQSGNVASGVDKTATFAVASNVTVNLESSRKIGNLSFANANQTISGGGKLALATGFGIPRVTVGADAVATINVPLEAGFGLEKSGTGTLVLRGSGDKTIGGTHVTQGSIELDVAANLGGLTIGNTARFIVHGAWNLGLSGFITIEDGGVLSATHVANSINSGLLLKGGTVAGGGSNSDWGVYTLASDVTADDGVTSTISAETGLAGAVRTFTVTAGSTLIVSGVVHNSWQHGPVGSGNLGSPSVLSKVGPGTMAMTAANGYTGHTQVLGGTLSLGDGTSNSNLADTADVMVEAGAILHLNFTGTDAVDELFLGGAPMSPGTYTSSHPSGLITGTGALVVTNGPSGDPFLAWIDATWLALPDKTATGDPDHDGMANLLEYVLQGGDPSRANPGIQPTLDADGSNFVFTFHRRSASAADTTQVFQYGSDLTGWTLVPIADGGQVSIRPDTPSAGVDEVVITLPKGSNTSLFGRLQVTK